MKKDNKVYLNDMLEATEKILEYCENCDYEKFATTELIQDAVIRNIEVLGEAATNLSDDFIGEHPELPVKKARGMRNLLIHHYDFVDVDEVWNVIDKDLLPLRKELEKIIRELE